LATIEAFERLAIEVVDVEVAIFDVVADTARDWVVAFRTGLKLGKAGLSLILSFLIGGRAEADGVEAVVAVGLGWETAGAARIADAFVGARRVDGFVLLAVAIVVVVAGTAVVTFCEAEVVLPA
jgi:hypothetical protein